MHDSAELALRAAQLGGTHATGAPLHTIIGHWLTYVASTPAAATTWLSVVCAALTAGLVVLLISEWVARPWLAAAGGLVFALLPPIWINAVITELYAPSLLLVSGALLALRRWEAGDGGGLPLTAMVLLGLALGAHFANALLLPVLLLLVLAVSRKLSTALLCGLLMLGAIALVAAANVWLALRLPPLSEHLPLSAGGLWLYMTGAEHQARVASGGAFYMSRVAEHLAIVAGNFVFVGLPFIALGWWRMWRATRRFATALTGTVVIWFGYFTLFGSGDYFVMIGPVYLLCAVWLALGVADIAERWSGAIPLSLQGVAPAAALAVFAAAALLLQWQERRNFAQSAAVQTYVDDALAAWPDNAVVIARWNEFTALRYAQVVDQARGDVSLLLPARTARHYEHGIVSDYFDYVSAVMCERPVVTNKLTAEIEAGFAVTDVPGTRSWLQLQPPARCQ
ncbi:MAG: DUF2723 domain-containing protein [Gammaproteobacteria bacterium]|nr:DUF2723 domain-containing protein [Gammaproteobacteria bacterium]